MRNRIEEGAKIIRDIVIEWEEKELAIYTDGEDVDFENWCKEKFRQICQLFPQPLDGKELREKIAQYLYELRVAGTIANWFKWEKLPTKDQQSYYDMADGFISALLQPKIEEAVIQARKEQMVIDWEQAGKDAEEAKEQERERIFCLAKTHPTELSSKEVVCRWFNKTDWQALKGGE